MYIYLLRLYNKQGSSSTLKLDKWIDHAINSGLLSGDVLVLWMQIMALIFIFFMMIILSICSCSYCLVTYILFRSVFSSVFLGRFSFIIESQKLFHYILNTSYASVLCSKYFHPICCLPFHFLNVVFWSAGNFHFDEAKYIIFFFYDSWFLCSL